MINFIIKKISKESPHYNLTFMKLVHKRSGDLIEEPGDTLYTLSLDRIKNILAHKNAENILKDENVSLKDYFKVFYQSYNEVCELLKKTL